MSKEKNHATRSASGSHTWMYCPGSIEAQSNYQNKTSSYAEEGTLAHELADICLKNNQDAIEYVDREISVESDGKILKKVVDEEMAKWVQEYLDYVRAFETTNTQLFTEDKVDFSNVVYEGFGTMDSAVLDFETGICHIFDLKYGMVEVSAEDNSQGLLYATGFHNEMAWLGVIKSFVIHIVQPRKFNYSSFECSLEYLEEFKKKAKAASDASLLKDAARIPGEKQCTWCNARNDCPALENLVAKTTENYFENLDKDDAISEERINKLSDEKLRFILDNKSLIEKFLKNVEKTIFARLLSGESFKGYKLIRKKANRKWSDGAEAALVALLGDKAYTKPELIGLTAAEKLLNKKQVNELTYKPDGQIAIANELDPSPAVQSVKEDFDNLNEENDL